MVATPPPQILQAALDAGLLSLQHKVLNAGDVRPVQLDLDVLRLMRAQENSGEVAKLLSSAQRSAPRPCSLLWLSHWFVCSYFTPTMLSLIHI